MPMSNQNKWVMNKCVEHAKKYGWISPLVASDFFVEYSNYDMDRAEAERKAYSTLYKWHRTFGLELYPDGGSGMTKLYRLFSKCGCGHPHPSGEGCSYDRYRCMCNKWEQPEEL